MSKPTPRPWFQEPQPLRSEKAIYSDRGSGPCGEVGFAHTVADSAHIVKCVNMHDALVRALRDTYDLHFTGDGPTLKQIEELLAKAEAE